MPPAWSQCMWVSTTSFVSAGSMPACSSASAGVRSSSRPRRFAEAGLKPVSITMVRPLPRIAKT